MGFLVFCFCPMGYTITSNPRKVTFQNISIGTNYLKIIIIAVLIGWCELAKDNLFWDCMCNSQ